MKSFQNKYSSLIYFSDFSSNLLRIDKLQINQIKKKKYDRFISKSNAEFFLKKILL